MRMCLAFLFAPWLFACDKPVPPELHVQHAQVTTVDATGVTATVHIVARNPNKVPLVIEQVTGRVVVDGKYDLGEVNGTSTTKMSPGAMTSIDIPLHMNWPNVSTLAALSTSASSVPYTVTGTAIAGTGPLTTHVSFKSEGTLTREQLVRAAMSSLPAAVPGLPTVNPP